MILTSLLDCSCLLLQYPSTFLRKKLLFCLFVFMLTCVHSFMLTVQYHMVQCLCIADSSVLETHRNNPVSHGERPLFGSRASRYHSSSIHSILQTDATVCKPQEGIG